MKLASLIAALTALLLPAVALADKAGFAEALNDSSAAFDSPQEKGSVELTGFFRSRGEMLYNLDLDRGLTPSGQALFPVSQSNPKEQAITGANMRLRTDLRFRAPGTGLSTVLRTDILDNLSLGSTPDLRAGTPGASPGQVAPQQAFQIKRAYGEALLPIGIITVGRQGSQWGLGMVANAGDCEDCDSGDAADRISFVTPLVGHIFALAYDISATGPQRRDTSQSRSIDIEPTDDVKNLTFAFMRYHSELARIRRSRAGLSTIEYGAYLSHRWQDSDIPSSYLGDTLNTSAGGVVQRGLSATATDFWFRLSSPHFRIEGEAAWLRGQVDQASLLPGVEFYEAATSNQLGGAIESEFYISAATIGLNAGFASGDPAPGFGAFPGAAGEAPKAGELDGQQANLPFDTQIDNFRFHSDYRVDRILFREIIGTVTDAIYLRPHFNLPLSGNGGAKFSIEGAAIASWAVNASSTPSGTRALGVEFDPSLRYENGAGFVASLDYALLLPLGAFDNPVMNIDARPAQLLRLRLRFPF